ncbi:hypothetical protein BX666DRAFT_1539108 [Dichotomocladium elegans]|nr:hypothetical protein BX666DRAFT_1539108 [Dichotomocladium elegans]
MDTTKLLWTNKTQEIVDRSGGHAAADEMQFARYGHSAVLVGDHVFILFGVGTYTVLADSFLILDTTTWTMTNSFPGLGSTDGGCSPDASRCEIDARRLGAGAIAGIAVGCAAAVAIMLLTLFCLYRRRKHKKPGDAALSDDMKTKTTDGPLDFGQEKLNSCTADTEFSVHAAVNSTQPLRLSPIKPDGLTDSPGHMDGTTVHLLTQKPDGN